jgi:hypothetical protein
MKRRTGKRHTPEQIIRKLREADTMLAAGKTIGQVCRLSNPFSVKLDEFLFCG